MVARESGRIIECGLELAIRGIVMRICISFDHVVPRSIIVDLVKVFDHSIFASRIMQRC
jgi:hypothetical protein